MRADLKTIAALALLVCLVPASAQAVDDQNARALIRAGVLMDPYDVREAVRQKCQQARISRIEISSHPYWHYIVELSKGRKLRVHAQTGQILEGQCP